MKKSTILIVNGGGYVDSPHSFSRQTEEAETPLAPIGITFKKSGTQLIAPQKGETTMAESPLMPIEFQQNKIHPKMNAK